jgi:hypothetical protein
MGGRFVRSILSVVLIVIAVSVVLLIITANRNDDFWRLAVPTYLTGVGTLALAVLNVILLRQEAADRQALAESQARREQIDAERDARKILTRVSARPVPGSNRRPEEYILVLNASTDPILDVKIIRGSNDAGGMEIPFDWHPATEAAATYRDVVLPNEEAEFRGEWVLPPAESDRPGLIVSIGWTDSRGLHWRRDGRALPGQLETPFEFESEVS